MSAPPGNPPSLLNNRASEGRGLSIGRSDSRFRSLLDAGFRWLCQGAAVLVLVVAVLLLVVLVWQADLAIQTTGLRFFTSQRWDPVHRQFGAVAFIWGTVATSALAMLLAVPLGIGTAAFLSEIAPGWLRRAGSFLVEMLAAVPSVVYGFWGLFVLAPAMQDLLSALGISSHGGVGILTASLILAIMIVPYVAAVSFDACRSVPRTQREAALALGATRWQTIWSVVLPYARPGILGGGFLALGRALGETMAVTMLIGNRSEINLSPFAPGNSIASVIANEFNEATYDLYSSALVELGLVLLLVSVVVNAVARLLIRRLRQGTPKSSRFGWRLAFWKTATLTGSLQPSENAPTGGGQPTPAPQPGHGLPGRHREARWTNRVMTGVLGLCLVVTVGPLFLILGHLLVQGIGALNREFFVNLPVPPTESGGGLAHALYGSFLVVGLASLLAVPTGVLAAIYLAEYRSDRLGAVVRFIGELLSGVPSIVVGIFVYQLIVRPTQHFSGWAGAIALAIIMIPVVLRASEEALRFVPQSIRNASHALGASQCQTVMRVVVPAGLSAILTAVFLAIARIAGETAPLLLTAGGNNYWPRSPNDSIPSLPVYIFEYSKSPYPDATRQAWAAALVLLLVVMILNVGVRLLAGKRGSSAGQAE